MTRRFLQFAVSFACVLTAAMTNGQAQTLDAIIKRGQLLAGVYMDNPPTGYTDSAGQPVGSDIETAQLLAKNLGVTVQLVPVTAPNRIPYLLTGRVDVVLASLAISAERAKTIAFSNPYGSLPIALYASKDSAISGPADLAGKRISVVRGSVAEQAITRMAPPSAQISRYDDDATTITSFVSGQTDALVITDQAGQLVAKNNPARNIERKMMIDEVFYSIGLRRGDPDFSRWLNTFVFVNRQNGQLQEIYRKNFGRDLPTLPTL
jgi:polar amino acid transport system substrate-binding protein